MADEPRAVRVARDMLAAGGHAADGATALFLTLSVTLPSQAGLGGGGVCMVRESGRAEGRRGESRTEFLDFAPVAAGDARGTALPTAVRGIAALHARYGRLGWGQVIAPAEALARFGGPVSLAFARDLRRAGERVLDDPETRRLFGGAAGGTAGAGDQVEQIELAAVLSTLRTRGAGALYSGPLAAQLRTAYAAAGAPLDEDALRSYVPAWRETVPVDVGNDQLHLPPSDRNGALLATLWAMLDDGNAYAGRRDRADRDQAFGEAVLAAYAMRGRQMPGDPGRSGTGRALLAGAGGTPAAYAWPEAEESTGFSVIDREGNAVTCAITQNGLFGTGVTAPGTGIRIVEAGPAEAPVALSLSVLVNANDFVRSLRMAAGASGGPAVPAALVRLAADTLRAGESLQAAVAAPRLLPGGDAPLPLQAEDGASFAGAATRPMDEAGTVFLNAAFCSGSLPSDPASCDMRNDPRGNGLVAAADR